MRSAALVAGDAIGQEMRGARAKVTMLARVSVGWSCAVRNAQGFADDVDAIGALPMEPDLSEEDDVEGTSAMADGRRRRS